VAEHKVYHRNYGAAANTTLIQFTRSYLANPLMSQRKRGSKILEQSVTVSPPNKRGFYSGFCYYLKYFYLRKLLLSNPRGRIMTQATYLADVICLELSLKSERQVLNLRV